MSAQYLYRGRPALAAANAAIMAERDSGPGVGVLGRRRHQAEQYPWARWGPQRARPAGRSRKTGQ